MGDADFIVLDEPTTGVDPLNRRRIWNLVQQKRRENKIILICTHYMDEAEILADCVGIMCEGRLAALGSTEFLKQEFECAYGLVVGFSKAHGLKAQDVEAMGRGYDR